jgi:hypothetical protein
VGNWLVIPYLALFCWLLPRWGFVKRTGLGTWGITLLFLTKVLAGFVLGWAAARYTQSDYWQLNGWGWDEYRLLVERPGEYFGNLFSSGYAHGYEGLLDSTNSYWNDLKTNVVIKLISVFDIFSRGNYYVNSIFFNVIAFAGQVAFYRVFAGLYPHRRMAVAVGCFLLPSLLLFSSAVHKDPLVFAAIGGICLTMYQWHQTGRLSFKKALALLLCLFAIFLLRNLVLLAALPALLAYVVVIVAKWKPLPVFAGVYLLAGLFFFNAGQLSPSLDLPARVAEKQGYFLTAADASTSIPMDTLRPTALGFLRNAPQAASHALLRPYLTEPVNLFLKPIALEFLAYLLLFVLFLFFRQRQPLPNGAAAFLLFGLLFALVNLLSIGYIVNNLGAIVRYRSLYLALLITPLLAGMDWEKLGRPFKLKK